MVQRFCALGIQSPSENGNGGDCTPLAHPLTRWARIPRVATEYFIKIYGMPFLRVLQTWKIGRCWGDDPFRSFWEKWFPPLFLGTSLVRPLGWGQQPPHLLVSGLTFRLTFPSLGMPRTQSKGAVRKPSRQVFPVFWGWHRFTVQLKKEVGHRRCVKYVSLKSLPPLYV